MIPRTRTQRGIALQENTQKERRDQHSWPPNLCNPETLVVAPRVPVAKVQTRHVGQTYLVSRHCARFFSRPPWSYFLGVPNVVDCFITYVRATQNALTYGRRATKKNNTFSSRNPPSMDTGLAVGWSPGENGGDSRSTPFE